MAAPERRPEQAPNGAAMAAVLAAAIGAFAVGFIVILNEAGLFAAPAVYPPAGGVSGRTTLAVLVWLAAWTLLHRRWRTRQIAGPKAERVSLALIVLGLLLAFPPVWRLF